MGTSYYWCENLGDLWRLIVVQSLPIIIESLVWTYRCMKQQLVLTSEWYSFCCPSSITVHTARVLTSICVIYNSKEIQRVRCSEYVTDDSVAKDLTLNTDRQTQLVMFSQFFSFLFFSLFFFPCSSITRLTLVLKRNFFSLVVSCMRNNFYA